MRRPRPNRPRPPAVHPQRHAAPLARRRHRRFSCAPTKLHAVASKHATCHNGAMPAPLGPADDAVAGPATPSLPDTAHWVAMIRAIESERADPLFRDPFARRLAGAQGRRMLEESAFFAKAEWTFIARTLLFDDIIQREISLGADAVVSLAAGLDARAWRMTIPSAVRWFELDFPEMIAHKQSLMAGEQPACTLECIGLDLTDAPARLDALTRISARCRRAIVIAEGFMAYLEDEQADAIVRDLAGVAPFRRLAVDLGSPGLLAMLHRKAEPALRSGATRLRFAPPEGPAWFEPRGWTPVQVRSFLSASPARKRFPLILRVLSYLPQPYPRRPSQPWGGVCLFERAASPS